MQKSMINLLSFADVVSLTNSILGFLSIVMIFLGETYLAFSFILLAILADGLDGAVARKTKHSDLGEYMEAMADMISLGIAPAFFVYHTYHSVVSDIMFYHGLLIVALIIFLSLGIIRLASFHIIKDDKFFVGLPASASTIFIIILSFLQIEFLYILPFVVLVSLVMVSPIRFPKTGLKINAFAAVIILITLIFGGMYNNFTPLMLFATLGVYAIIGPIYVRKKSS